MAKPAHGSVLATLRCLGAVPASNPGTAALGASSGSGTCAARGEYAMGRVHARHYQAFLSRKVSSSVSSLLRCLEAQGGAAPKASSRAAAATTMEGLPLPSPFTAHPPPGVTHGGPAAPRLGPALAAPLPLSPPPARSRKRTSTMASLDDTAPALTSCQQPTSSTHAAPNVSEDGTAPATPAEQPAPVVDSPGRTSDAAVEQRPPHRREPAAAGGTHAVAAPSDAGVLPALQSGIAQQAPRWQAVPPTSGEQHQHQQQQQPKQLGVLPCAVAARPVGRVTGAAAAHLESRPGSGRLGQRGAPGPAAVTAVPDHVSRQASAVNTVTGMPAPAYGGTLYPHSHAHGSLQRPRGLQPQPLPHYLHAPQQHGYHGPPTAPRLHLGPQMAGDSHAPIPGALQPRQLAQPHLCSIPPPSLTLQALTARLGAAAPRKAATPGAMPKGGDAQHQQTPTAPHVDPASQVSGVLDSASPQVRNVLQRTAAAAGSYQRERAAKLPPMEAVLQRWPLESLERQFGSRAATGGPSGGVAGPGPEAGSAGALGPGLMRLSHTPLPRRHAVTELELSTLLEHRAGPLPLAAVTEPLPADTCPFRRDLWDLYQEEHVRLTAATQTAASPAPSSATPVQNAGGSTAATPGAGLVVPCMRCCHDTECGVEQAGFSADSSNTPGSGSSSSSLEEEPDVYVTDEGLVCLASLVLLPGQHPTGCGTSGWRLPFLVKQQPQQEEPAASAGGEQLGSPPPPCPDCGCVPSPPLKPAILIFTEPLFDEPRLLLDSWTRVCAHALAGMRDDRSCGPAAVAGAFTACSSGHDGAEPEDCPFCQQDEWKLGGLRLLVLSHCQAGLVAAGPAQGGAVSPLQLRVVAVPAGGAGGALLAAGGGTRAWGDAVGSEALRQPELVVRAELLSSSTTTLVMGVDPATSCVVAMQRLDPASLARLAAEGGGSSVLQAQHHWRFVHNLLLRLRRLPPGPYMLCLPASGQHLELRGAGTATAG